MTWCGYHKNSKTLILSVFHSFDHINEHQFQMWFLSWLILKTFARNCVEQKQYCEIIKIEFNARIPCQYLTWSRSSKRRGFISSSQWAIKESIKLFKVVNTYNKVVSKCANLIKPKSLCGELEKTAHSQITSTCFYVFWGAL